MIAELEHHAPDMQSRMAVQRPPRQPSRLAQWALSRQCRKIYGHCWHPLFLIDWWCCLCSAERDGMPARSCVFCDVMTTGRWP